MSLPRTYSQLLLLLGLLAAASYHPSAQAKTARPAVANARSAVIVTGPGLPACPAGTHVGWFTNFCFPN